MKLYLPSLTLCGYVITGSFFGYVRGSRESFIVEDLDPTVDPTSLVLDARSIIPPPDDNPPLQDSLKAGSNQPRSPARRRSLKADTSIVDALKQELEAGSDHPRFTLTASYQGSKENLFTDSTPFQVDVVMTDSSITDSTTFSVDGGPSKPIKSSARTRYLIADQATEEGTPFEFAILSVDMDNGSVRGLVQKNHELLTLTQDGGSDVVVYEANTTFHKDWSCTIMEGDGDGNRHLHEHHDHSHHQLHDLFSDLDGIATQLHIDSSLQNRRRTVYQTDNFPAYWSYQADLYLEVDTATVENRDPDDPDNMPNTIEYLNALITAISSIYQREIDTKLNILHIAKTSIYDDVTSTRSAIDLMIDTYGSDSWHYRDSNGHTPDLHHLIMWAEIGGGIASLGQVCNPQRGFGMSAGCTGSLDSINEGLFFWDLIVVAHEFGHNFASEHTHSARNGYNLGYDPLIDACGADPNYCRSLVDESFVGRGDATIMSYCHLCPGGENNIAATFGGQWIGNDRTNIDNWRNTDGVEWSRDPKRVSQVMWQHISTRGECVEPYLSVPSQLCTVENQEVDCDDNNACSTDICIGETRQCSYSFVSNCCGNGHCEFGESPDCTADCGPLRIRNPDQFEYVNQRNGMFVDVEAISSIDIDVSKFMFVTAPRPYSNTIRIYTAPSPHADIYRDPDAWTEIASMEIESTMQMYTWRIVEFSPVRVTSGNTQSFYVHSSGGIFVQSILNEITARDNYIQVSSISETTESAIPFQSYRPSKTWYGIISYTLTESNRPPTMNPTTSPTNSPTLSALPTTLTKSPTTSPTLGPSVGPTISPTRSPTTSPTTLPSFTPSEEPSFNPSSNPSISLQPTTTTRSPSTSPMIIIGPLEATFDSDLGAPRCSRAGTSCDSVDLVHGRSVITNGPEPNEPNTLDGCADGNRGSYGTSSTIDRLVVRSGEVSGLGSGVVLAQGGRATIIASVSVTSASFMRADFFYTNDATNPSWQLIGTRYPFNTQVQDIKISYTLPEGATQAVRVQLRLGGQDSPCYSGSFNDRDDMVFAVISDAPTTSPISPTGSPSNPPTTSSSPTAFGTRLAVFDETTEVPRCFSVGAGCDSGNLVYGSGTLSQRPENLNQPNTLYGNCADDPSSFFTGSVDRIRVISGEGGDDGNEPLSAGNRASIVATVYSMATNLQWNTNFFVTSNPLNPTPTWLYIGTVQAPSVAGSKEVTISFNLPVSGNTHAVRIQYRYQLGSTNDSDPCVPWGNPDRDDLVFDVIANPTSSPSASPSSSPTTPPTAFPSSTPSLSISPTTPMLEAVFDSSLGVPHCSEVSGACDSGSLLSGCGSSETNYPNTLDGCTDYRWQNANYGHLEGLVIQSGEVDGSGRNNLLTAGARATIRATIFAPSTSTYLWKVNFYYTSNPYSPNWSHIGTTQVNENMGYETYDLAFTLDAFGTEHAIRVQFKNHYRWDNPTSSCFSGGIRDVDDLVFTTQVAPTISPKPSSSPSLMPSDSPSTSSSPSGIPSHLPSVLPTSSYNPTASVEPFGPLEAVYDSDIGAPKCEQAGTSCDTTTLVAGRVDEPNRSNIIDNCMADGTSSSWNQHVQRIVVSSDSTAALRSGEQATITATVYAWISNRIRVDFFYATNAYASSPSWTHIQSQTSPLGENNLSVSYTLPTGATYQAIRVQLRYHSWTASTSNACYRSFSFITDRDDLVFQVLPSGNGETTTTTTAIATTTTTTRVVTTTTTTRGNRPPTFSPTPCQAEFRMSCGGIQDLFCECSELTCLPNALSPTGFWCSDAGLEESEDDPITDAPTAYPTTHPTSTPTSDPITDAPTAHPTTHPTSMPTHSPLHNESEDDPITDAPTTHPTSMPTSSPISKSSKKAKTPKAPKDSKKE